MSTPYFVPLRPPPPLFGTSGALTLLASGTAEELGEHADDDGGGGGIVSLVDASTVTFLLLRYALTQEKSLYHYQLVLAEK